MHYDESEWLVTGHHNPPHCLHFYGCFHLTSNRPNYSPEWRKPTSEERVSLPACKHCARKYLEGRK